MTTSEQIINDISREEKLLRLAKIKQAQKKIERERAVASGATMTGREVKKLAPKVAKESPKKSSSVTGRYDEEGLRKKYPSVVKGSLKFDEKAHKQTCSISCVDCKEKRDVYTSDLHQVTRCRACHKKARTIRRMNKRKALSKKHGVGMSKSEKLEKISKKK